MDLPRARGRSRDCSRSLGARQARSMWRNIRLTILVGILFFVELGSWLDQHRSTSWENTVRVGAFPVTGDASAVAASYVAALNVAQLQPVSEFIAREAHRYGVPID